MASSSSVPRAKRDSMTTGDSSGPSYTTRPEQLPSFGSDEYYRIKSMNLSPTTTNESELGSSTPPDISSGENLFFPQHSSTNLRDFLRTRQSLPTNSVSTSLPLTLGARRSPTESDLMMTANQRKKSLVTVLKAGSAETVLRETPRTSKNSEEIPLLPTNYSITGKNSEPGSSFHGRSAAVHEKHGDKTIHLSDPILWEKGCSEGSSTVSKLKLRKIPTDPLVEEETETEKTNGLDDSKNERSNGKELLRFELHLNSNGSQVVHSPICTDETTSLVGGASQRGSSDEAHG